MFKWLTKQNYILYNPASDLDLPKATKRLPKHILTASDAETILNQPDTNKITGIRDRTIMEVLYSTGMRRMELVNLKTTDIDIDRGTVLVRHGKGDKDRMIPIGERAILWIEKYLNEVRPELVIGMSENILFLNTYGEEIGLTWLSRIVRNYIDKANINKTGSCHLFRHTMATLMLENGADIRYIQAMLGHAKLDTTQIYTQVSIQKLKDIHTATHPAKNQKPNKNETKH
jgi:integrase/recombinase XerD